MLNLLPDDFITVVEWIGSTDMSYVGDVFRVTGVDENLILVDPISKGYLPRFILNLDRVEVRKVSDQFALKCASSLVPPRGRVVFESTGGKRPPKEGEYFRTSDSDFVKAEFDFSTDEEVYRLVEDSEK